MKKTAAAFLLLTAFAPAFAPPASAISRGCTAAMVSLGLCRNTSDAVMCLAVSTVDPDNGGPKLAPSLLASTAVAENNGFPVGAASANLTCTQEMVSATICNSGQLGTPVSVTRVQFSDMMVKRYINEQIRAYRQRQKQLEAQTELDTEPAPDVGN